MAYNIDNTDGGDIERCITWQYDHATKVCGFIDMLKDFFNASTEDLWGSIFSSVSDIDTADDFGLAVWGKILGVTRPQLSYEGENHLMSSNLFRNVLKCRARILNSAGTVPDYEKNLALVFGDGEVQVIDNHDMSVTFSSDMGHMTTEQSSLFTQCLDIVTPLPAGVYRTDTGSVGKIFALSLDNGNTRGAAYGTLDESVFDWSR